MELIVIGDSHTWVFKGFCDILHIDNPTAYNIHNHRDKIEKALRKDELNLFSFGDIDCRVHIYNQHKKTGKSINLLIHKTVQRYINFVLYYSNDYKIKILSLPPCGTQGNRFNKEYYADYRTMKYIYFIFNCILEAKCLECNLSFVNYYLDAVNEKMDRKKEMIADEAHLNKKILPFILRRIDEENEN